MLFSEVIGQYQIKEMLQQMVDNDRLPHALLFLGPRGCGKLALAIALSQYVLCENKQNGDSCGQCKNCGKAAKLIHPDLHFSYPTVGTNVISERLLPEWRTVIKENPYLDINEWLQAIGAENRQGNINKEECVNIIRKLSLKTFESTYKVQIIWLPEYLKKEGNRLLKIIEEPPENTIFILVAENQEEILNTILSRCQLVKLNTLSDEDIVEALVAKKGLSEEEAMSIAHLADGDFNNALTLSERKESNNAKIFLEWMRLCYKGDSPAMVKWVEEFAKLGRENQKHFISYALHFMREFLVLKMTGQEQARLQTEELSTADNLQKILEFEQVEAIVSLLNDCSYYVERNAHPKVLFLDASINLNKILKRKRMETTS